MSATLDITTTERGSVTVVELTGSLDGHTFVGFERHMQELVDGGTRRVVVDLAALDYIASAGVGVLINVFSQLGERDGILIAARPGPMVGEVFAILGLEELLPIRDDLDSALQTAEAYRASP